MKKLLCWAMPAVLAAGMSIVAAAPAYAHGHHHGGQGHCENCANCPNCEKGASQKRGNGHRHCPHCAKADTAPQPAAAPAEKSTPQEKLSPQKK